MGDGGVGETERQIDRGLSEWGTEPRRDRDPLYRTVKRTWMVPTLASPNSSQTLSVRKVIVSRLKTSLRRNITEFWSRLPG